MPPTHATEGLDAARVIRGELPNTAITVLSAHVDVEHAMELLSSGHSSGDLLMSRPDCGELMSPVTDADLSA